MFWSFCWKGIKFFVSQHYVGACYIFGLVSPTICQREKCLEWKHQVIKKGKFHPRTGHEGPEGEWWYRATLSITSVLDEMVGGQQHSPATLLQGRRPSTFWTGGWVGPGPVCGGTENLATSRIQSPEHPALNKS
jgi:hypothetical protein